ncbi:MAG: lytic transglycosylase domain-containing protein [Pyrinomonadaceae bacterium]
MSRSILLSVAVLCGASSAGMAQRGNSPRLDNIDVKHTELIKEAPPPPVIEQLKRPALVKKVSGSGVRRPSKYKPFDYELSRRITTESVKPLNIFTTGNQSVDSFIRDSGTRNGVDPVLIYAIMHQESAFKQKAVSYKGARGLMQLMPATAVRFGVRNIFDPRDNIEGGAKYMRFLLDTFDGDVPLALAGYNAGEGAVLKYGRQVPPYRETREYVRRIGERYAVLRDPLALKRAKRVSDQQLAALQAEPAVPATIYEQQVFAVRLPNGKLQLVRQ